MKKFLVAFFILTLIVALDVPAWAVTSSVSISRGIRGNRGVCAFVDADGDGICDNRNTLCPFVDENGDGICDYFAQRRSGNGTAGRGRQGGGWGCQRGCQAFVNS